MKTRNIKSVLTLLLVGVLFAAMTLSMGCGKKNSSLGTGSKEFTFVCVDANGTETTQSIKTDAATVGEALQALGIIEGEESEWGLYVKKVNGITADYDVDGTYWAFYINGEYAMTGVDSTDVEDGATYTFKVE